MTTKIQLRRGTADQWASANPVLSSGEVGFETDSGKIKIGNGSTVWTSLDYFLDSSDISIYLTQASASTTYLTKISSINTVASATYTLVLEDASKIIEMDFATANTLTIPLNSTVAFPIGTSIDITQYGAGQTTIAATVGVMVRSSGSEVKLTGQYSGATIYKRGTDDWILFGDLTA